MDLVYADHPYPLIPTPILQDFQNEKTTEPDMFARIASEMALVHNMIIRGLNSIYLQAQHVSMEDTLSFLQYTLAWHSLLHVHHSGEEADFFPFIEEMTGEKGLMDCNVNQHKDFQDGIERFKSYVDSCVIGNEAFMGAKLVTLIDEFGQLLSAHLHDEISSILHLRKFGVEALEGLEQRFGEEGQKSMKALGLVQGLPFCFASHDVAYEGRRWAAWPPAPKIVVLLCRHVTFHLRSNCWRIGTGYDIYDTGIIRWILSSPLISSLLPVLLTITSVAAIESRATCRQHSEQNRCIMSANRLACDWPRYCPDGQSVEHIDNAPQCKGKAEDSPCTGYWKCCTR
ncbi:hypothetical protein Cob_v010730 [Colletotrichum orbiculare MAFF 240422]|uniref:Hemerythrin-like domain-containing protein n=1 Tax=Colletotrichum orbiculare (strain 104-T / ATCC 96160 / CBS 514.97 / LARS 414 / MAFF 240422) TaxID=1213857 RepID=A0A484FG07_COLOR|nr:hypothetical protein Cob_v010730 [Colletotrichum orbiculare MAFF 240422]